MAKKGDTPDPMQMWREWVDQSERQWNTVLNEFMSTEEFGQASSKMMEAFLGMQSSMSEATQRYFSALNLPTRSDVLSLGDRLAAIERTLAELSSRLEAVQPAGSTTRKAPSRPRPRRTKKAPATKAAKKKR